MLNNFVGKDIINIGDMTPDQFQYLLDLSKMLKAEKMTGVDHARFHNKNVVAHFEWESTRTRCAFETSCHDLGLGFTYLSNSHFGNKETVKDSIRVFSEMYDAIVLRAQREEAYVREVADIATIPVINACCEGDHPTQMLADALTMQEVFKQAASRGTAPVSFEMFPPKGELSLDTAREVAGNLCKLSPSFVSVTCSAGGSGNGATTAMWYGRLCALLGMDFYAVGPDDERYQLCDSFKENIEDLFNKWAPNNEIVLTSDKEKLKGMDVVTTECWIYQNPDVHDEDLAATGDWTSLEYSYDAWLRHSDIMEPYRVTSDLMEDYVKNPDCLVMHMLPAYHNADMKLMQKFLAEAKNERDRRILTEGICISDECFEKHASEIFREAGNRQPTIKACLAAVLGI